MTPQSWMILLGVTGILAQVVTSYVIIKISVAVLEERMNGFRALVEAKLKAQDEHLESADSEIVRLRDWRHDIIAPMLQKQDSRLNSLENRR